MTTKESIETFGQQAMKELAQDMIFSYECELEFFRTQGEYLFRKYLECDDKSISWVHELNMKQNKTAQKKLMKLLKKWQVKAKVINGELDEDKILVDLDSIKAIPMEQFLPAPVGRGQKRTYYKAPWRDETQGSVVVFGDNRFHDFGDPEKRGSVIDLIMLLENLEFKEAVNYLKEYL